MPVITLPDESQRRFDDAVSVADVAADIGRGLAKATLAGKVDGRLVDASHRIDEDARLAIVTDRDPEGVEMIRHSTAHLMAHAVKSLFPSAQVTIGPVIDDGFYYDFAFERPFHPEDLEKIEAKMKELAKADLPVERRVMPRDEAAEFFRAQGEEYKARIIEDIPQNEDISLYTQGDFVDLCRGPHVPSTGKLKAFKLTKVAGAYWRGDSKNEMLQRIYGTAWPNKQQLEDYLHRLAEAERRDHRRIGQELNLFSIQDEAGGGLVFWHPNGARIRRVVEQFWYDMHERAGYEFLYTPHIANLELWKTSGHADFYGESMYEPMEDDNQAFQLKPMNCPFHVLVYKDRLRSYRDLPLRWAEMGTVYRREMSGALHGLMRVRGFTQDDAHIFCREDQIEDEILRILDLTLDVLRAFGFDDFDINLSTRPDKAVGSDHIWEHATAALRAALEKKGLEYELDEGGGAFYGPKIDIKIRDAIGRQWQCSTVQLDFNLPERFDLEYVADDNQRRRPIMVHRALLGSVERFFGVLIEHYAGSFPLWLAPVQAQVLTITDRQDDYAREVVQTLRAQGLRAEMDLRNEKIGFKIREHTLQRVPYLLVLGDREMETRSVAVRSRTGQDLGTMDLDVLIQRLSREVADRGRTIVED
ncbi:MULTISPECIES: threonine--tRNA ligase [Ectothiorhodospira]|uniref:threonine--tRNA ligase n=1 Tax=Ectothiorhodospira TaxID=1051 RepID=UPI001EE8A218|nr:MULTISPECIES: threonine--tRNA ligase [Ectothiorhodospira]MCG5493793.1 threonine--tRNA ligase [Ectothiorhodospira variabilis]MCG5497885.1 threonine--tRNA ligase [Ectothiorhodospira variabilis]MCG5503992.1 threonine--tRNA ligase [Ectothiorhodospira variabilis]MCG5507147.1 threonine--tRNA ligase [Ectothiorhodospira variabilis]MCG5524893.1 threonine--tRNA ligase [Ectothiorhodospira haloalkaliphila]